jgi:hypothetical protein
MEAQGCQQSQEATRREKAREVFQSGKVPRRKPVRTLGGFATGEICVVCSELLTVSQLEIEFEFNGETPDTYHAHPRCFVALELEFYAQALAGALSPGGQHQ